MCEIYEEEILNSVVGIVSHKYRGLSHLEIYYYYLMTFDLQYHNQ